MTKQSQFGVRRRLRRPRLAAALGVGLIAAALPAAPALADAELAMDFRILSMTRLADGTGRAEVEFILTNTGDVAFEDLFVEWYHADPWLMLAPPPPSAVGALLPGENATAEVTFDIWAPTGEDTAMTFVGTGRDADVGLTVATFLEEPVQ